MARRVEMGALGQRIEGVEVGGGGKERPLMEHHGSGAEGEADSEVSLME